MAINYWEEELESTGEYVQSVSSDPMPEGTKVLASIIEAKWHMFDGSKHENINLKWQVEEPEEYNGKTFYQMIKVNGDDPNSQYYKPEKQDKVMADARLALSVIDKHSGGNIFALKRKVTTEELKQFLVGAKMIVTVGVYNNKQLVRGISAAEGVTAPSKQAVNTAKAMPKKPADNGFDSDDIPF